MGYKKNAEGRWIVDVSKQGFRDRKILPEGATEDDALILNAKILEEHRLWLENRSGGVVMRTIGDCLELFKKEKGSQSSDGRYNWLLKNIGSVPVHDAYGKMMATIDYLKAEKKAPATINRYIALVKAAINHSYEKRTGKEWRRLIPENYMSRFPMLQENNIKYLILNPIERDVLYNELADVDLNIRKIWVPQDRSKNGEGRHIPIPPLMLDWYKAKRGLPTSSVFLKPDGRPYGEFRTDWNNALKAASKRLTADGHDGSRILGYNWHKTRQQAAMELMYDGWDSLQVMHVGGWRTMKAFTRYVQVDHIMLDIKQGLFKPDLSWREKHAEQLLRRAA